ncbi:unnamed protein product [Pararhodospirillum photometricum DSM 122]|uniref:Uncharacterized protein n=1 Tax=Pararhodospirillum photometricum DSM 122 TaxID=1150469 RepID=H6SNB8_PARPM|nr:unnamed protein product [Pararhodospirillum photometricum DSM 122]
MVVHRESVPCLRRGKEIWSVIDADCMIKDASLVHQDVMKAVATHQGES